MPIERSSRTLLAVFLIVAALLVGINYAATAKPALDWWLPLVLVVIGIGIILYDWFEARRAREAAAPRPAVGQGAVREWIIEEEILRPEERITVTDAEVPPLSVETPFVVDLPPETPETFVAEYPDALEEAAAEIATLAAGSQPAASQEGTFEMTAADAIGPEELAGAINQEPAKTLPGEVPTPEAASALTPENAADIRRRTEGATPEATADKAVPTPPPPSEHVTQTDRTRPAEGVVLDVTDAPQQPHEVAKTGVVTPEVAEKVVGDQGSTPAVVSETSAEAVKDDLTNATPAPASAAAPATPAKPDDLTVIEGIGPKMDAALKAAGIDTYAKLAQTTENALRAAIEQAGMRFAPTIGTWPEQAAFLARGDESGFKTLVATLRGGRKPKE